MNETLENELIQRPDTELVRRYVESADETAYTELVRRHGELVLGVCTRVLRNRHDAEDAFQATFFVLAKSARKIRRRDAVASWLYGVAYRISRKVASQAHRSKETLSEHPLTQAETPTAAPLESIANSHDLLLLEEEINRLPHKYRNPIVLYHLAQHPRQWIARELGLSEGAVKGRLERGRNLLRQRLSQRGITFSAVAGLLIARQEALQVSLQTLLNPTVTAGIAFGRGTTELNRLNQHAINLAKGEMNMMMLAPAAKALTTVAGIVLGATLITHYAFATAHRGAAAASIPTLVVTTPDDIPQDQTISQDETGTVNISAVTEAKRSDGIKVGDVINIQLAGVLPDHPLHGDCVVEPEGVLLGSYYGRVLVQGNSLEAAEKKILKHLEQFLTDPRVAVTHGRGKPLTKKLRRQLQRTIRPQDKVEIYGWGLLPGAPIEGEYTVEPGGAVHLGLEYGRVRIQGRSFADAEKVIKKHLEEILKDPGVTVTLGGWRQPRVSLTQD